MALARLRVASRSAAVAPQWALAGGVAALVLVAFLAGRFSTTCVPPSARRSPAATDDVAERVLVVAVVDHLDRSQMVLLELLNADFERGGRSRRANSRAPAIW